MWRRRVLTDSGVESVGGEYSLIAVWRVWRRRVLTDSGVESVEEESTH